ncbi:MAG: hypothetical protein VX727_06320 [Planctomycetota bacterium]|nr:hypothetical protein [Planctomycetota bacterium]
MRPFALLTLILLLAGGCAASGGGDAATRVDPYSGVPDDFSLDVTILAAEDGDRAHHRNARYVLFPDGTLLHDALPGRGPNTLPGFTRRLSSGQMAKLWSDIRQLGLGTPDGSDEINNFRRVRRPATGHVYLIAVTADGEFWNYTRSVSEDEQLEPALKTLLRELAVLAWAQDDRPREARTVPTRYDFGPDPYAQYRVDGDE